MKHPARGFTLIELVVAMVLVSTLLTVVAMALGGLARADRRARERIDRDRNVQRFVSRLRQDIHQARTCTISLADDNTDAVPSTPRQTLVLACDEDDTIRFEPTKAGIVRTVTRGGVQQHHEPYVWGSSGTVAWAMDTTHELPLAILTLTIAGGPKRPTERLVVRTTLLNAHPAIAE